MDKELVDYIVRMALNKLSLRLVKPIEYSREVVKNGDISHQIFVHTNKRGGRNIWMGEAIVPEYNDGTGAIVTDVINNLR